MGFEYEPTKKSERLIINGKKDEIVEKVVVTSTKYLSIMVKNK